MDTKLHLENIGLKQSIEIHENVMGIRYNE